MLVQLGVQLLDNAISGHRVLEVAREPLQGHADYVAMMQLRAELPVGQIEPELVNQIDVSGQSRGGCGPRL